MKKILISFLTIVAFNVNAQKNDSTVNQQKIDSNGVYTRVEKEALFPGGESAWNQYIQRAVEKNIDKISKNKASFGTCEVQFIVDTDGSITNVEALTLQKSVLAKIFVEAVKNGPKWIPATIDGKPVKAWRRQKVTMKPPQ